jgi:hypothetical protein
MLYELLNMEKNENIIYTIIVLFLVLYGKISRPKLPVVLKRFLQSDIGRIIILAIIAYQSNNNFKLSVIMSIGFIFILNFILQEETEESYNNLEKFTEFYPSAFWQNYRAY